MKIIVALNSFKGTASSSEINKIISYKLYNKGFDVRSVNISDGGDGFIDCFKDEAESVIKTVTGPFYSKKIKTEYIIKDNDAFIEIAKICGLGYLKKNELDPLNATTYGVGEVIKDAVKRGVNKIYIGLGGTASNDCGFGMAKALGARFYDKNGNEIENSIYGLLKLDKIDFSNFTSLSKIKFYGVSDVTNKLLGKYGSARVFGSQKGANDKDIKTIEKALSNLTRVLKKEKGVDISKIKSGASAGGLGAGVYGFLKGELLGGSDFIIKKFKIDKLIRDSDIVITGEGKLDRSSFYGKISGEIVKLGLKYNKKIIFITAVDEYNKKMNNVQVINLSQKYPINFLIKKIKKVISDEIENINFNE